MDAVEQIQSGVLFIYKSKPHLMVRDQRDSRSSRLRKGECKMERIKRFFKQEEGITALEYGLIAAATCTAIVAALLLMSSSLSTKWSQIASCFQ